MFHKEVKPCHSEEHKKGITTSILRKTDMIGHKAQRKSAGKGNGLRERPCKNVDHRDGERSEDERDDPDIPFWPRKWI